MLSLSRSRQRRCSHGSVKLMDGCSEKLACITAQAEGISVVMAS